MVEMLNRLMDVAIGERAPDLVVRGTKLINLHLHEVEEVDILVASDRIAAVVDAGTAETGEATTVIQADGAFAVPGLFDAHFHMGGSHLPVVGLADALLARGTTAIATDFYEIYTVAGPEGVRQALGEVAETGLKAKFLAPLHLLGLETVGTFGWDVKAEDFIEMLSWPETIGVMEPPASIVLARHPDVLRVISHLRDLGKTLAGHAPGLVDRSMQAYLTVGASSDHESQTEPEAVAKLRRGMQPMMRKGSAAPDLPALVSMVHHHPQATRWMMVCSDEVDPGDLVRTGHMDEKVRMVIDAGVDPITAVALASVNVAEYFNLSTDLGTIAPGRRADIVLVKDLDDFRADVVVADGAVVSRAGQPVSPTTEFDVADRIRSRVNLQRELVSDDFHYSVDDSARTARMRVIGVEDGSLVSSPLEGELPVIKGVVQPSIPDDVLNIAIIERHKGSGRIRRAFASGFGFHGGAVAMTYCHVYHNVLVVGASPGDMALAANTVADLGGGIAVVRDGQVVASWALPIVGVISDQPLDQAQPAFDAVNEAITSLGCKLTSPVLSLSFVALPTIPAYGLTDLGLYDVLSGEFRDPVLELFD